MMTRVRPVYVDRLPPCNASCPAGEDVQGWLYHAESGDYEAAWRHLTRDNPFPAVMGRVCYHACERACNRGKLDDAVGIASVERFLGDEALRQGWQFDAPRAESGKHILVVGAGPSGMAAAYHLRRLGHRVTLKEAGPAAGGMMRFGIPRYRLPREVLDAELRRIVAMGVDVELDCRVARITGEMRSGGFDAAFLAVGAPMQADCLLAPGQEADLCLLEGVTGLQLKTGLVQIDPVTMMTGHPGLFAGGDVVMAERSVAVAAGHGKKAARAIDAWLRGERRQAAPKHAPAAFGHLKPWYYSVAPRTVRPQLDIARRTRSFGEVQGASSEDNALCEARRCLSCGNCFECESCVRACLRNAIVKLGPGNGFRFDLDQCDGCGNCAAECPCGAIEMVAETILAPSPQPLDSR